MDKQEHDGEPLISLHSLFGPQGEGTHGFLYGSGNGCGGGAVINVTEATKSCHEKLHFSTMVFVYKILNKFYNISINMLSLVKIFVIMQQKIIKIYNYKSTIISSFIKNFNEFNKLPFGLKNAGTLNSFNFKLRNLIKYK